MRVQPAALGVGKVRPSFDFRPQMCDLSIIEVSISLGHGRRQLQRQRSRLILGTRTHIRVHGRLSKQHDRVLLAWCLGATEAMWLHPNFDAFKR